MATVRWQKDKSTKPNYPKQVLQTLKSSGIPMSEDSWKFSVFRYFKNCLNSSLFLQQKTDILTGIADLCRLQYWDDRVQTPRLIASENTYILLKINANMDIRIWVSQAFVKRFLSCNLPQRKLMFSSWVGFCERNNHVHKFWFAWVSLNNIFIEKGRNRPEN